MADHELRQGNLLVSLTSDAYDYNHLYFTLELTELNNGEGVENDADVSGLPVTASEQEINMYLAAALAFVKLSCGRNIRVKNMARHASQAGMNAIM